MTDFCFKIGDKIKVNPEILEQVKRQANNSERLLLYTLYWMFVRNETVLEVSKIKERGEWRPGITSYEVWFKIGDFEDFGLVMPVDGIMEEVDISLFLPVDCEVSFCSHPNKRQSWIGPAVGNVWYCPDCKKEV